MKKIQVSEETMARIVVIGAGIALAATGVGAVWVLWRLVKWLGISGVLFVVGGFGAFAGFNKYQELILKQQSAGQTE